MYDHYIAFDWAQRIVAVARMTQKNSKIQSFECSPSVSELQVYLKSLKGKKCLVFEESTTSQWLYTEFKEHVDKLIVCDPRRNRLLLEGPKSDRIDAEKLVRLLKADMLKPVFHSSDQFIYFRKLVSGYEDLVKAGVRAKNQRSALFRAVGLAKEEEKLPGVPDRFVLSGLDSAINLYEQEKDRYLLEFQRLRKQHGLIKNLYSIPGIGDINAVKIAAIVVNPRRFQTKGHFLSYCGLVKHDKQSGGTSYGKRNPQYHRTMKSIFKTAALANISRSKSSPFNSYYRFLIEQKKYAEFNARHAVARRVAVVTWGVLKSGKKVDKERLIGKI